MKVYDATQNYNNKPIKIKKCDGYTVKLNDFFPGYITVSLKYKGKDFLEIEDVTEVWNRGNKIFFKRG